MTGLFALALVLLFGAMAAGGCWFLAPADPPPLPSAPPPPWLWRCRHCGTVCRTRKTITCPACDAPKPPPMWSA